MAPPEIKRGCIQSNGSTQQVRSRAVKASLSDSSDCAVRHVLTARATAGEAIGAAVALTRGMLISGELLPQVKLKPFTMNYRY